MFKKMKIQTRLVLIFSIIGIGIIFVVNYIGYTTAKRLMEEESYHKLIAVREIKKKQVQEFFGEKINDIMVLARGADVHQLFEQLVQYHIDTEVGPNDPYDVSTSEYNSIYDQYGSIFNYYIETYDYHDIYMMCSAHGHVMYSTAKEKDLGTNLNAGPYRNTHLAELWRKVVNTKQVAIEDFQPYEPNNNEPVAFIGTPIVRQSGDIIGMIALEISVDEINSVMLQRDGLGETGETYLVGSDKLMRSDSFLDPANHSVSVSFSNPEKSKIDTEASREALDGKTDVKIVEDYRGVRVLSAYTPVDIPGGIRWALLAEIDESEAFSDVYSLRNTAVFWGILLIAIVIIGAVLFSRSITHPLKVAVDIAERVSEGDLNVEFNVTSEDEVGQMLLSTQKMIRYIQEAAAVSERISQRDLEVEVTPKSKHDVLNQSLQKMVVNLRSAMQEIKNTMAEIEQQNWLKDGVNQLNTELVGEASLRETCNKAVSFVARFVEAGYGVLYTYDAENHMLNLGGAFAFTEKHQLAQTFRLGEGVIGQVAQDRAPILLKNLKRSDQVINTGTVSEPPLNTYTFPLMYNEELYGVLELASFEEFDDRKQNFLNEANQVIATVLFSALQRERVQELLLESQQAAEEAEKAVLESQKAKEEAQHQAEEVQKANAQLEEQQQQLQQQSEELQQINAHLEEQQQQVQQQREELRQQNENLRSAQEELELRAKELEEADRYKSEFLAEMSHELRTPLNSVILVSKMLLKNAKGNLDDKDVKQIDTIYRAAEDVLRAIDKFLGLSKSEDGKFESEQEDTSSTPDKDREAEPTQLASLLEQPVKDNFAEAEEIDDDRASISPSDRAILIIEDNADFAQNMMDIIKETGFKVLVALNGYDGLSLAGEFRPTGILLDLMLPDINGMEVLRELKSTQELRHIPVHILSSKDRDETFLASGAVGYYQKPVSDEDIQEAVKQLVAVSEKYPKRVLIVEDNETQREAIQDLIGESDKVETTGVASQNEAIQEIDKGLYDAAIIDLGLQDGSGYDICKYIKEHDIQLPVIIYTGKDLTEEEERELRTYTDSIIIKTARSDERLLDEMSIFLHTVYHETGTGAHTSESPIHKEVPQRPAAPSGDLNGKKILVADDDVKNVFVLASALEKHGTTVIDAKNGEDALDKLRREGDIDLVLMDVMMPGMDGYTTMREIRKDEQLKHLPIIALTAKALKEDRQKCIQAGADDYLSKPVDYDGLIRLVSAWIEKG